jgi:2-amino-4-hydroxy-6-hydroxymethyldihydropteridine diphosphokinase
MRRRLFIALGANLHGTWGSPEHSVLRAIHSLGGFVAELHASRLYRTSPVGPAPQPDFVNAVVSGTTELPPEVLLVELKRVEALAGRTEAGPRWGPRPLDLDIIDMEGLVLGWQGNQPAPGERRLTLPHPEMHIRAFVLRPLQDVAPGWRHPVLGLGVGELLALAGAGGITPLDAPSGEAAS